MNGRIKSGVKYGNRAYNQLQQNDVKKRAKTAQNKMNNYFVETTEKFRTPHEMEKDQMKRIKLQLKDIEYWHMNKKNFDSKKRTIESERESETTKPTAHFECREGKVKIETFINKMEHMKGINQNLLKMDTVRNHLKDATNKNKLYNCSNLSSFNLKSNEKVRCKTGTLRSKERSRK